MFAWLSSLDVAGIIFACIAFAASIVFLVQLIMTLVGLGDEEDGFDAPDDAVPGDDAGSFIDDSFNADFQFHFFSFRGIVAFLVTFGWMGLMLYSIGEMRLWLAILISFVAGVAIMSLVAVLLMLLYRMQSDGTMHIRNAVGTCGVVYLTIPPARSATGKVTVVIQGASREVDAVTDSEEPIATGTEITVVGVRGEDTLVVVKH